MKNFNWSKELTACDQPGLWFSIGQATFVLWYAACNLWYWEGYESNYTILSVYPTIHPETFDLYQLETVPVPILDRNTDTQSYMHLQVRKPYIALDSEIYISLRQQELRSCKRIGCKFYCEELFIVKHKSSYSCESAIYFNLTTNIMRNNVILTSTSIKLILPQLY